jgi:large subunit ribosomal protein L46
MLRRSISLKEKATNGLSSVVQAFLSSQVEGALGTDVMRRCASTSSEIYASCVALERLPVVMPQPPAWEIEFRTWQQEFNSKSFKVLPSQFTQSGASTSKDNDDDSSGRKAWAPAPLETRADKAGDTKSLRRRLDQRLFLLVQDSGTGAWGFLNSVIRDGEDVSSRSVAERAMEDVFPGKDSAWYYFVGNAPAAHTKNGDVTQFYHRCQLIGGEIDASQILQKFKDYAWVAPDEFGEYLKDDEQASVLKAMA